MYDVIIIGSGPAGLAAAIYAQRAKLEMIIIEENYISGGQESTHMRLTIIRDFRASTEWISA